MKKIIVNLIKKNNVDKFDLNWILNLKNEIEKKESMELNYKEFENFKYYENLLSDLNYEIIYKNKFGFLNYIKDIKNDSNNIVYFNIDIYNTKWIWDESKKSNDVFYINNLDNVKSLIEKMILYKNQNKIIYWNLNEESENFLKQWSKIFNINIKKDDKKNNNLSANNFDVSEFAKMKYKNFNWKIFDVYKNPDENNELMKISQEQIIQSLYGNALKAIENKKYKNHFITAPTGTGKSLMFQSLAYLLSKKHDLLTIIVSPLKSLMEDQIKAFKKIYKKVATINSDISYVEKIDTIEKIKKSDLSIIYVSPETLLSNSYENLFGDRKLGSLIIDEAHIATTWGKGFRPDYWYLDTWISNVIKKNNFLIATFTATASYHYSNPNSMNNETKANLLMNDSIEIIAPAYRNDIEFLINKEEKALQAKDYKIWKFEKLYDFIFKHKNEKILIYFPYTKQIDEFEIFLKNKNINICKYYGRLERNIKKENFENFRNNKIKIMLATKAFGMGIDIDDIKYVLHYAPTGTLSDYLQEVGRVARRNNFNGYGVSFPIKNLKKLKGSDDFKFIKQLHGMSSIKMFELIRILKVICYSYNKSKKQNLIIPFENLSTDAFSTKNNIESRLKTCFLMLQRDLVNKYNFPPIIIRPSGVFTKSYISLKSQNTELKKFLEKDNELINAPKDIFKLNLEKLWESKFEKISFPMFKFLLFSNDKLIEKSIDENNVSKIIIDKIKLLKKHFFPRQIIIFNDHVIEKIKKSYFKGEEILKKLIQWSDLKTKNAKEIYISKEDIIKISSKELSKYMIEEFLFNFRKYRQFIKNKNKDIIFWRPKINYDEKNGNWIISKDINSILKSIFYDLKKYLEIGNRLIEKTLIMPMQFSDNFECKKAFRQIKLFESLGEFNIEIKMGENLKAFVRVNSISIIKEIIDNNYKRGNNFVISSNKKHKKSIEILEEFFFEEKTPKERKKFIEKQFLMTLQNNEIQ